MKKFVAIANIEPGGHYTTAHEIGDAESSGCSMLEIWVEAMSKEIGFCDERELILEQGTLFPIEEMSRIEMASFVFGGSSEYHCIVIFVML